MPGTFALFATFAAAYIGGGTLISTAVFYGISGGLYIGASLGLTYLSQLIFKPSTPKPEDVQSTVKSAVAPRWRYYGRNKFSGSLAFVKSKHGGLSKVIALCTGQLDAIEEFWIDDNLVEIDVDGNVTTDPYDHECHIQYRLGLPAETTYADLGAEIPEWDASHRGDGVASLYIRQDAVSQEDISKIFPRLAETAFRVVARCSLIKNSATDVVEWGDNAADVIRDFMTHPDGMRLPAAMLETPMALAGWVVAHNRCAEAVDIKAGGTEPRYRLWGGYQFNERPGDVLQRMLVSCDGRIVPTPDGGFTLDVGDWSEPTVTIDETMIVGFSDVSRGRDVLQTANIVRATYLSPFHDYQSTDADQWIDDDDVAARGEYILDTSFIMSPSHGQTRRLMKLAAYRANPSWVGSFQCNLKALAAFGKRFIRVTYPLFGIDEVMELIDFRFNFGEGQLLAGVSVRVQSMPGAAYEWDYLAEEGTAPISEDATIDDTIPTPDAPDVTIQTLTIGGVTASYAVLTFDPSPTPALIIEARGRLSTDPAWSQIPVNPGDTSAIGPIIADAGIYQFQIRYVTITGRVGPWSDTTEVVAYPGLDFSIAQSSQYFPLLIGW